MGQRGFWKRDFIVNPAVLIPRPDTETLVDAVLSLYPDRDKPLEILDLGIGSGAILYSLLEEFPQARGVGTDISPEAVEVAGANRDRFGLGERVELLVGDLTAPLSAGANFDLIVSNPPYIVSFVLDGLQPEVRDREPRLALDGGDDGLDPYRRLIPQAAGCLRAGGHLLVEIGHDQGRAVSGLFADAGFASCSVLADHGRRDRVVTGVKS